MVDVEVVPVLEDNYCFILTDAATGFTTVVDPPVVEPILDRLKAKGGRLDVILATHHHSDHVDGIAELKELTGARVIGPEKDRHRIAGLDQTVGEGDRFMLGSEEVITYETHGHTIGHVSFYLPQSKALFCGDTIFVLGCGRLSEGDAPMMWASIKKLMALPDDVAVYCGHEYTLANARFAVTVDPGNAELKARLGQIERARSLGKPTIPSTMGEEKATNPFLRPSDPAIRQELGMEGAADAQVFGEIRKRKDTFRPR